MKYLCVRDCYMDADGSGKCRHYTRGEINSFKREPHNHWVPAEKIEIDFETVTPEIIMASDEFNRQEAEIWLTRQLEIDIPKGMDDERFANFFVNARERAQVKDQKIQPMRASTEMSKNKVTVKPAVPKEE
jgi:hypothetical protein